MAVAVPVLLERAHSFGGAAAETQLHHDLGAAVTAHLHEPCGGTRAHALAGRQAIG
jgi:hypothetical protein